MSDPMENFRAKLSQLNDKFKADEKELWRAEYGACPHHKGHFDISSFFAGLLIGISATTLFVSFVVGCH